MTEEKKSLWESAKDGAEGAVDKAKDLGDAAAETVKEAGSEAWDKAEDLGGAVAGECCTNARPSRVCGGHAHGACVAVRAEEGPIGRG